MLLAVAHRPANQLTGTFFRIPVEGDYQALESAHKYVQEQWEQWDAQGLIPAESIPLGSDNRPQRYGMRHWHDMFSPRQLLTTITAVEELHGVLEDAGLELDEITLKALNLYLGFAVDKIVNWNSRLSSWNAPYTSMRSVFDRHDFAFKWSYAEMEGIDACRWGLDQVVSCYQDLSKLAVGNTANSHQPRLDDSSPDLIQGEISLASATMLPYESGSVDAIVTDPPYYDNVMYAELSDYFYVWLKRTLKPHWPELCQQYLSDKDNEAVANRFLFADQATHSGRGKRRPGTRTAQELATSQYETLMSGAFAEAHRVLRDHGTMTVMFTHKRVDAWNALATAMLKAGFQIASSWPISTESPHSLHQKGQNAANATILLTCSKRQVGLDPSDGIFWSDIEHRVRQAARQAAIDYASYGLIGVDVTLASFGPALAVLSEHWPVYTGELNAEGNRQTVSPEMALDLARQEVARAKLERLLPSGRTLDFDPPTNWWLLAWADFETPKFASSEALKLSQATHLDLDTDLKRKYRMIAARGGTTEILTPSRRFESKAFALGLSVPYDSWIDRLHALMVTFEQDGLYEARHWLEQNGLSDNDTMGALLTAALQVVPRERRSDGDMMIPEAQTLENIRATLFPDIEPPPEPEISPEQSGLPFTK